MILSFCTYIHILVFWPDEDPKVRVENSCHKIKLFVARVLVVIANINKYYGCCTNEDISYEAADYRSFLTPAIDRGEYSMSHPSRFRPGEGPQHPLKRRLHGPKSQSKIMKKKKPSCLCRGSTSCNRGSLVLYSCGCSRESKGKQSVPM